MRHSIVPATLLGTVHRVSSFTSKIQSFYRQGHWGTERLVTLFKLIQWLRQKPDPGLLGSKAHTSCSLHYPLLPLRIPSSMFHLVWKRILPSLPDFSKKDISFLTEDSLTLVNYQFPQSLSLPFRVPQSSSGRWGSLFNQVLHCGWSDQAMTCTYKYTQTHRDRWTDKQTHTHTRTHTNSTGACSLYLSLPNWA